MAEESNHKPTARRTERVGKYEIVGHIAKGGMGVIYKARDVDLDRLVALKVLPAEMAAQPLTLIRFQREAKAAARLRHENIVAIFDVGEANGTHFIALEYIEGTDLQDYINHKAQLEPDEARQIMIQAARALVHAHERGIVHRDIKPSNFLLTYKDDRLIVKLTDFGLAIRHENEAEFRITKDKTTVGTVDYMAPEQARDSRSADIRSDIYSLGCTFYHMLGGNAPFARGTLPERIVQHMKSPPPDVRKLNKFVPEPFVTIIQRMLAKKPDDRYQTPADLLNDLEHPEKVGAPVQRKPAPAKLARGPARKKSVDPTQVIEKREMEEPEEESRATSAPRVKRPAPLPREEPEAADEDSTPTDDYDEPTKTLDREDDTEDTPRRKAGKNSPVWKIAAVGLVAVVVIGLIVVLIVSSQPPPVKPKDPDKPPAPPPPVVVDPHERKLPPPIDTSPAKMTVPELALLSMDKVDRAGLRKDYYGAFTAFPTAPPNAPVLRVSRLAPSAPDTFRTLAEAFAATKPNAFTVIEIADDGPIFVPALPALAQRSILLRGADGHRPLLVWDPPKKAIDPKGESVFCLFEDGKLILDNLDLAMRWSSESHAVVFDLPKSDVYIRDCTFSMAGKAPDGIALLRRQPSKDAPGDKRATQTWLQRCYVRGPDMTLLRMHEVSGTVLVEESLIVGSQQPLIDMRGRDEDALDLACVRSTLVTRQILLRWGSRNGKGISPPIACKMLDSILSRDDTNAPPGDLVHLADGGEPRKMTWRAANTVYAGWRQLLSAGTSSIAGADLEKWHGQWFYGTGDRVVTDVWPGAEAKPDQPADGLEDQPAVAFLPAGPVAYTAATGPGSIGAVIGWLPRAPEGWIGRTFELAKAPTIQGADKQPPAIETSFDNVFHGERLDLNKVDLGRYLADLPDRLQKLKMTPGPRVVLHLFGKGSCPTSPVRIKGLQHLVLYVEREFKDPPTLEMAAASSASRAPLFEMTDGHLELIGARIRLGPATLAPTMIQVHGGDVTLTRCWLQGPHLKSADAFQNLIAVSNIGPAPTTLLLRDNVLVAAKVLIRLQDHVQLKARNNVFLALGSGVQCEVNSRTVPMTHVLDHNTWASRETFFTLRIGPEFQTAGSAQIHASSNAFLHPFTEDADQGILLRGFEPWVSRGRWTWQGQHNVYDTRLHAYFAGSGKTLPFKQTRLDWQAVWGALGEQEPLVFTPAAAAKTINTEGMTPAALLLQLDRLALPTELRGNPNDSPPGADLVSLGIKKKA